VRKFTKTMLISGAALLTITACTAATGADTDTVDSQSSISTGLGSQDATADVVLGKSTKEYGVTTLPVKITNNSEKASNYSITIVAESKDGDERIDDSWVYVENLKPGQKTTEDADFFKDLPKGTVFTVTEVQRTAF
jgi:ABC-type glycerol-3-phosphate transport system substrate-binding protein